jgi:hypothetical protein
MNPENKFAEIIHWLQSTEGEKWSYDFHAGQSDGGRITRHSQGVFASIKWDHENCNWNSHTQDYIYCGPSNSTFSWTDRIILLDIEKFGMTGVPEA